MKRPSVESYEGKSPALGDHQARALLDAPDSVSLKGKRDRAIFAILLYHALRRDELCKLKVKDVKQERRGVLHMKVSGKGGKTRILPVGRPALAALSAWLAARAGLAGFCEAINRCLLYTSDAADERSSVDLGGRRIIKKKKLSTAHHRRSSYDV